MPVPSSKFQVLTILSCLEQISPDGKPRSSVKQPAIGAHLLYNKRLPYTELRSL
jgi:hypothetical protein